MHIKLFSTIFVEKFQSMIVLKFGGTSVGNAANIKQTAKIIGSYNEAKIVVLSAVSGTTNSLVDINSFLANNKKEEAISAINQLEFKYHALIDELFSSEY